MFKFNCRGVFGPKRNSKHCELFLDLADLQYELPINAHYCASKSDVEVPRTSFISDHKLYFRYIQLPIGFHDCSVLTVAHTVSIHCLENKSIDDQHLSIGAPWFYEHY